MHGLEKQYETSSLDLVRLHRQYGEHIQKLENVIAGGLQTHFLLTIRKSLLMM
jgi:hypothetical protein